MRTGLRNLLPPALVVFSKAEAVSANDHAVFKRHVIAKDAVLAHHRVRMREEVAARLHAAIEHHMRQQRGMRPQPHMRTDHSVCADVRAFANLSRSVDHRGRVNSGRVSGRLIEKSQRTGKRMIRICNAQGCSGNLLKIRLNQDRRSLSCVSQARVARVGHKGDLGGTGFFNALDAGNLHIRVSPQLRAQQLCQLA
jgi:hypothetical protein